MLQHLDFELTLWICDLLRHTCNDIFCGWLVDVYHFALPMVSITKSIAASFDGVMLTKGYSRAAALHKGQPFMTES